MKYKDFITSRLEYCSDGSDMQQIMLPNDEYAHVISELNTHMSDGEERHRIVTRPIGDYYYTVINQGFNDYVIIGKRRIVEEIQDEWSTYEDK